MPRTTIHRWTLTATLTVLGAGLCALIPDAPALAVADAATGAGGKMQDPPKDWTWADNDAAWDKIRAAIGKPAPALKVKEWQNGEVTSADTRGQIVVYDFWATWCGPCIRGIPHTNEMAEKYAPAGVKVVAVCASRGGEKMAQTVKQHDMRYPTAVDIADATTGAWSVQWFPYFVIVDRKGVVRAAGLRPDRVDDVVEALLKEQPLEQSKPAPRS